MKKPACITSVRIKNFKAIQDSGPVKLGPLTVFIGNNGSGKSSFIEALEALQLIVQDDLDRAMLPWHGFEHAWNKASSHADKAQSGNKRAHKANPMSFTFSGQGTTKQPGAFRARMDVTMGEGGNTLFIQHEKLTFSNGMRVERDDNGITRASNMPDFRDERGLIGDGRSVMQDLGLGGLGKWQFLLLNPQTMGEPFPQTRAGSVRLAKDGRNVAEYLNWIRKQDISAFEGIVEAVQYVLPYASDIQPVLTSELERLVYLQLTEQEYKIPGWLLSTGTLRILALLALLRSPEPPPLLVVEEIENGLDPRAIGFLVDEIRSAISCGDRQIIITTHSPYLLDKLALEHIVTVDRPDGGSPVFRRPAEEGELRQWATKFAPGSLYSMGMLRSKERRVR